MFPSAACIKRWQKKINICYIYRAGSRALYLYIFTWERHRLGGQFMKPRPLAFLFLVKRQMATVIAASKAEMPLSCGAGRTTSKDDESSYNAA